MGVPREISVTRIISLRECFTCARQCVITRFMNEMSCLAISGWAQPHDALAGVVPEGTWHLDYHACRDAEGVMALLARAEQNHFQRVVGWSLGGVLLLSALMRGVITADQVVLIGVPYQFVSCDVFAHGMDRLTFDLFHANYAQDAPRTAARFAHLIAHGDRYAKEVLAAIPQYAKAADVDTWLPWLRVLEQQKAAALDLEHFPSTLILHGEHDRVVSHAQAEMLAQAIPHATLVSLEGCGHAPHWHHPELVREQIEQHARAIQERASS